MCPPPGRQQIGCQNLRCLVFFDIRIFCKKLKKINFPKFVLVFGSLPPPGWQQIGSQKLRYLVFFDIRILFAKNLKF